MLISTDTADTSVSSRFVKAISTSADRLALQLSKNMERDILERENSNGLSKLAAAVAGGAPLSEAKRLLCLGADPNHSNSSGVTPLHFAVRKSNPEMVSLLVDAGAWLEAQDKDKVSYRSGNWVKRNNNGGSAQKMDAQNETPLLASFTVISAIVNDDSSDSSEDGESCSPPSASVSDALSVLKLLLAAGASVNAADVEGKTALHHAMQLDHNTLRAKLVHLILERGANTVVGSSEIGGFDQTPLAWASSSGFLDVVAALLQNGADPNLPGRDGMSPLHFAARRGRLEVLRLLLERGAEPAALDSALRSPLNLAVANRKFECVAALEEVLGSQSVAKVASNNSPPEAYDDAATNIQRNLAMQYKAQGNELFKIKHFRKARDAYSNAINALYDTRRRWNDKDMLKVLYSNRAQAMITAATRSSECDLTISKEELEQILYDARIAIKLDPGWPKGWVRQLAALRLLKRRRDAVHWGLACKRAIGGDGDAEVPQIMQKYFKEWEGALMAETMACVQRNKTFRRKSSKPTARAKKDQVDAGGCEGNDGVNLPSCT